MKEIWKESIIPNYQVSNLGRVKNMKTKHILIPDTEEKGYKRITAKIDGKRKHFAVHRLVAFAFIPNPENKPQIDHIDCNKSNNRVDNLQWVTNKENSQLRWSRIRKALSKYGRNS